jgi:hypothetical protein
LLSLSNLYTYAVYSCVKRNLRDVSKLNTLAYSGGIFCVTVVPDIHSSGQCITIFILLLKSLERLELIFIFHFYYSTLFDSIIQNGRLYDKEATGANPQPREPRTLV